MTDLKMIDKRLLRDFLLRVAKRVHFIYATISNLPTEHCYVLRYYNNTDGSEGLDDPEPNTFSIAEFFEQYDTFDPDDEFGLCFAVHLDRINSAEADCYEEMIGLSAREDATIGELMRCFTTFLESYCEKCQRDNHPFELTAKLTVQLGLTPSDIEALRRLLDRYNAAARKKIRAEYDALCRLDFIRKGVKENIVFAQ